MHICHGWLGFGSNLENQEEADIPTQVTRVTGGERAWVSVQGEVMEYFGGEHTLLPFCSRIPGRHKSAHLICLSEPSYRACSVCVCTEWFGQP